MLAGYSAHRASDEAGIDRRTLRRYLGSVLSIDPKTGRLHAAKSDRLSARMLFPTARGDEFVTVRGSKARSQLGQFFSERGKLLAVLADRKSSARDKDQALVIFRERWQGKKIGGRLVQFDLEELARAGVLSVEGIYQVGKRGRQ